MNEAILKSVFTRWVSPSKNSSSESLLVNRSFTYPSESLSTVGRFVPTSALRWSRFLQLKNQGARSRVPLSSYLKGRPMKRILLSFVLCVFYSNTAYASWFGPDNYEDCILEGIPTAKTDLAVQLVMSTCRDKFPSKKKADGKSWNRHLDVLGEYVCEQKLGGSSIFNMFMDEKARSLRFGTRKIKIARSTKEALFSENYRLNSGHTVYWKIERLGQNYRATHEELITRRVFPNGDSSNDIFICTKSM